MRRNVSGWLFVAMIAGQFVILEIRELREPGSALVRDHAFFGYAPNLLAALHAAPRRMPNPARAPSKLPCARPCRTPPHHRMNCHERH